MPVSTTVLLAAAACIWMPGEFCLTRGHLRAGLSLLLLALGAGIDYSFFRGLIQPAYKDRIYVSTSLPTKSPADQSPHSI